MFFQVFLALTTMFVSSSSQSIRTQLSICQGEKRLLLQTIATKDDVIDALREQIKILGKVPATEMFPSGRGQDQGATRGTGEESVNFGVVPQTGRIQQREGIRETAGGIVDTGVGNTNGGAISGGTDMSADRCKRDCHLVTTFGFSGVTCDCPTGYAFSKPLIGCIDVNECDANPCSADQLCVNKHGSFSCESSTCDDGYMAEAAGQQTLNCRRAPTCVACADKPSSYTVTYVPFFSDEPMNDLPRMFYTFGGAIGEDDIFQETDLNVAITCTGDMCAGQAPSINDFDVKLTGPFKVEVSTLKPFSGQMTIIMDINITVHLKPSFNVKHLARLVIDVAPCSF